MRLSSIHAKMLEKTILDLNAAEKLIHDTLPSRNDN